MPSSQANISASRPSAIFWSSCGCMARIITLAVSAQTCDNTPEMPPRKRPKAPDMFHQEAARRAAGQAPLAARMRPRTLDEFVGQEHIVGEGRLLRKAIEADEVPSMVLWGPPGSGKTTLARIVAGLTQSRLEPVSAVAAGVADLRRIVAEARDRLGMDGGRPILFTAVIHPLSKSLPAAL